MEKYDYIIAGGGCAGLMLALEFTKGSSRNKSILIIDRDKKNKNDRTWCFWEQGDNELEHIISKKWSLANFYGNNFDQRLQLSPYQYKMVRSIDFYKHAHKELSLNDNITYRTANIEAASPKGYVEVGGQRIYADLIFNSFQHWDELEIPGKYNTLLQHFKGWFIRTEKPVFNPEVMTYMDFRVKQHNDTRFCYVLPTSENEALIEYTIFSEQLLEENEYEKGLKKYLLDQLKVKDYAIEEEEFGIIPMTDFPFPKKKGRIIYIGTTGGYTKASTGYTFLKIQKNVKKIVKNLEAGKPPINKSLYSPKRFRLYDSILLNVLKNNLYPAKDFFTDLFKKNDPRKVLKFLDEETNLKEEMEIMDLAPKKQFLKAFMKQVKKIHKL
ncbi:lycopene cyclase family protein [Fulvivirgaceae bacterium BMA10]|uniref:Lycopene cyclase family protein n=1 Tax=Splendidivirga corallicola TaxID=3051826 RepID=A0ABT8KS64_9BACT|nr:lycopene cyclase family protein [Fulvivirgaceae bacterium BMA10]